MALVSPETGEEHDTMYLVRSSNYELVNSIIGAGGVLALPEGCQVVSKTYVVNYKERQKGVKNGY